MSREENTPAGAFLYFESGEDSLGGYRQWHGFRIAALERATALYRRLPWWLEPVFIDSESGIPPETQLLLWERTDRSFGLLVPLLDQGYRLALAGDSTGFRVEADNNCPGGPARRLRGAYIARGDDSYRMLAQAFRAIVGQDGPGRLRSDKQPPGWIDYLGWCTWNAFYHQVTHEKVLEGLRSFDRGGIQPGFVILDDGWQEATAYGFLDEETYLAGLGENRERFPLGLGATVAAAKKDFGVRDFLVWHTLQGYWRGIDPRSPELAAYDTYRSRGRSNRPLGGEFARWAAFDYNVVRPEAVAAFYDDYHARLASQGVTGVKVDNQSHLEFMTYGLGPLTEVMGAYRRALESSVERHFGASSIINCMSLGSEVLFQAAGSTVTRNSNDFFPDDPSSHRDHLVNNAYNSLLTAQLVLPDWDMFQSGHPWGAFHAAARAISGGPVYVSDKVGEQDFGLLAAVALPDGRVLRCVEPALPTPDILFRDPRREDVLLKLFSRNRAGTFMLGAWNCRSSPEAGAALSDSLSVSLVPGTSPDKLYAVWAFGGGRPCLRTWRETWPATLKNAGFELYTISALDQGVAPLGVVSMFNSAGIFESCGWANPGAYRLDLLAGGEISLYSARLPARVVSSRGPLEFRFDPDSGLLRFTVEGLEAAEVRVLY
ncbi:MAG: hypothetical protein JXQ83_00020 [Candidatus Glassbacteria bacterium]|nr:hypothetical protein [Candidatus Glassbacteria bacterium]